jgi:heptosyltransferase III
MVSRTYFALKSLYWGYRRRPRDFGHRFRVILHLSVSFIQLWLIRLIYFRRDLIVIGMVGLMGDIIASEPVARAARRQFPNGYIVWIVNRAYAPIPERFDAVDKVISVTCLTEFMLLDALRPPCIAWSLHIDQDECVMCRSPVPVYGSVTGNTIDAYYNFGNLLVRGCRNAGIPMLDETPRFDPGDAARRAVDTLHLPVRFVLLHCVSNDPSRNWTVEAWDETANFVHETLGWPIVEIGFSPMTRGARDGRFINLCGGLSFSELAEVTRRAALFIGIDSGPSHFANAGETPAVLIFGCYRCWDRYMPYSGYYEKGGATILWADGPAANLPAGDVKQAITQRIGYASPVLS